MEKVKIASVAPKGSFESDYGTIYTWAIGLSDGTSGSANTKEQTQSKWIVGAEVWINREVKGQYTTFKLQKPPENQTQSQTQSQTGTFNKDPLTQRLIISQSCLGYSIEYHKGADGVIKSNLSDIKSTAKDFFDWVLSNSEIK